MFWVISGLVYSAVYVAAVLALAGHDHTRLIVGNVGLFLPPLATLAVIVRRRDDWVGRERVFWTGRSTRSSDRTRSPGSSGTSSSS